MTRRLLICGILALASSIFSANAQKEGGEEGKAGESATGGRFLEDFNYNKLAVRERRAIPYASLREADVVYKKRLERIVDVREKKNLPLKWIKSPLWRILWENTTNETASGYGKLKGYRSDSLQTAYTITQVKNRGSEKTSLDVAVGDPEDGRTETKDTIIPYEWYKIVRFRIVEEWIFDRQRSEFFPRIVAIAPVYKKTVNGVELGEDELVWYNWLELRQVLATEELFNRNNDAMRLSYLDFFEYRLFSSYIVKENNEFDMAINGSPEFKDNPMGALYEAERIKENLFNWEHDLWEY